MKVISHYANLTDIPACACQEADAGAAAGAGGLHLHLRAAGVRRRVLRRPLPAQVQPPQRPRTPSVADAYQVQERGNIIIRIPHQDFTLYISRPE